jgi:hypothetical protein
MATGEDDANDDYYPIHIARSDGKGYANLDHNALSPKEDKDVTQLERWEVILAGHLMNQLGPRDESEQTAYPRTKTEMANSWQNDNSSSTLSPRGTR